MNKGERTFGWERVVAKGSEAKDLHTPEQQFKESLLELGLLTEITPPLTAEAMPQNRQPAPVVGNPVSDLVILERR